MNYQNWRYEVDGEHIGWLTIDVANSSVNILRRDVLDEWADIITVIEADKTLTGLCFMSGKLGGFIYGADIPEFENLKTEQDVIEFIAFADDMLSRIENLAIPTACGIEGVAVGGGLEVALPFDQIVAVRTPKTQIGFPEINLGIMPGFGGTGRAARRIGTANALNMILSGKFLTADEALEWGLVDHLIDEAARLKPELKARLAFARRKDRQETPIEVNEAIDAAEAKNLAKADRQHIPAPFYIIEHFRAAQGNWRKLVEAERFSFAKMLLGEASYHLRRVFVMSDAVRKSARGDSGITKIHVIGAGTMGGDIASVAAMCGFEVTLSDQDAGAIERACASAFKLFSRRLPTTEAIEKASKRLTADIKGEGAARADIIIEAVAERLEVKRAVFSALEAVARPEAILATNTSSILIEDIAEGLTRPERLIGLHFFNPVPVLPLVEVIAGPDSDADIIKRAMCFAGQLKKMPVQVNSSKGFLVNRALLPYIFKAIERLSEGGEADKIDQALVGFGMPMGPIELADQIGLDVCYDVGVVLGMSASAQSALTAKLEAGDLGRKTGAGFYQWRDKKAVRNRADYPLAEREDIVADLLAPMIDKCRSAVAQNIVKSRDDADIGCILGIGFPRFRGGPLGWADYPKKH